MIAQMNGTVAPGKVLVITGGLLNENETSVWRAARKQLLQWRSAQSAWLDLKIKLVMAEGMVAGRLERFTSGRKLPRRCAIIFHAMTTATVLN